jgi:phosphoglycerate dehydrogenase-like enzyme
MSNAARICVLPSSPHPAPADRGSVEAAVRAGGGVISEVEGADGVVWTDWSNPKGLAALLAEHPHVRWVQLVTSGVDAFLPMITGSRVWTSAKGVYADPMAEWVLATLLAGLRGVPGYARDRRWEPQPTRSLFGAHVTIVGGGGVAAALIRLLKPFEVTIDVVRRSADPLPGARRTLGAGRLAELASKTDVLVLALALTPETEGLVDARLMDRLPNDAWLVNVARGRHVITDDLTAALQGGRLGGAVLDVTDPEPLPPDHPLWGLSNCLITPHMSCPSEIAKPLLLRRIRDNVARLGAGEQLDGMVDSRAGY